MNTHTTARTIAALTALSLTASAAAAGLTPQVQQRRGDELRALQLQIEQQQQTGPTVDLSPQRKLEIEQWRRGQQMDQLQMQQRQQREQRMRPHLPQLLQPPQLRPTPEEVTRQNEFRRQRDIQRLQRQPPPSR